MEYMTLCVLKRLPLYYSKHNVEKKENEKSLQDANISLLQYEAWNVTHFGYFEGNLFSIWKDTDIYSKRNITANSEDVIYTNCMYGR